MKLQRLLNVSKPDKSKTVSFSISVTGNKPSGKR